MREVAVGRFASASGNGNLTAPVDEVECSGCCCRSKPNAAAGLSRVIAVVTVLTISTLIAVGRPSLDPKRAVAWRYVYQSVATTRHDS